MSIWNVPLGLGIEHNPIVDSPYIQQFDIGVGNPVPPTPYEFLATESGVDILTENLEFILTE